MLCHILNIGHDAKGRRNKIYYLENVIKAPSPQFHIQIKESLSLEASWIMVDGVLIEELALQFAATRSRNFAWYDLKYCGQTIDELMTHIELDPLLSELSDFLSSRI